MALLVASLLLAASRTPVLARGWERLATQVGPAPVVLQVAVEDLDGDGRAEVAVAGRDYERQQDRLYIMQWSGRAGPEPLQVAAQSPPFSEPMSHVALAVGPFTEPEAREILAATNSRLVVWRWDGGRALAPAWQGDYSARVQQVAAVHLPGEPAAVALAYVRTSPRWHYVLQIWHWNGASLEPVAGPFSIGPVRAMTSGDLAGDGQSELVLEVGEGNSPGQVQVWRWREGAFQQATSAALRDAPVFGLGAGRVPEVSTERDLLLAADDRGRIVLYQWGPKGFSRVGDVATASWGLVSAALGDLNGDGRTEAVVVEYPNLIHVLRWQP